ncbi:MAG: alanine racemase [Alphaproteobacteria bacterium]|nr:alanine racemase [Alphaproteobacteria bacterium]
MTHNSKIIIDKNAIRYNTSVIKKKTSKKAKISAVIKANAYGVGGQKIAPLLYQEGIRDFFVAHFKEAKNIKRSLKFKKANIYILYDFAEDNYKNIIRKAFIPVLNTPEDIILWHKVAKNKPCVIHLDTGLSRLGIDEEKIKSLRNQNIFEELNIAYVMSHFSSANIEDSSACEREYKEFRRLVKYFPKGTKLSIANSGGIFRNKKYHLDMVRAGRTFYGLSPLYNENNELKSAISLKANVLQIKEVKKGQKIGYLGTYKAKKNGKIAIVNIGYADSLLRGHSNNGFLYFKGQKLPIIGLISMDVATVDISNLKNEEIKQGDFLEVLGENQSVDELGSCANTNGCEILTKLSTRYDWIFK